MDRRLARLAPLLLLSACIKLNAAFEAGVETEGATETSPTTASASTDVVSTGKPTSDSQGGSSADPSSTTHDDSDSHADDTEVEPTTEGPDDTGTTGDRECFEPIAECDPIDQPCPRGFACRPYGPPDRQYVDFGCFEWEEDAAVPVDEFCTAPCGPLGGDDDCDLGLLCDPFSVGAPRCIELCDPEEFDACGLGHCERYDLEQITFGLCRPHCDPLQNIGCPGDQHCTLAMNSTQCVPNGPSPVPVGSQCDSVEHCGSGALCLGGGCSGGGAKGCCVSFCSLALDSCGDNEECFPALEPPVPTGLVDLGVCLPN